MNAPQIKAVDKVGPHKTSTIEGVTREEIEALLGFPANCQDDPDKVRWSWGFEVDGVYCAIWDYKESADYNQWSAYGPKEALKKVFGDKCYEGAEFLFR